jgi:hypothetical protein
MFAKRLAGGKRNCWLDEGRSSRRATTATTTVRLKSPDGPAFSARALGSLASFSTEGLMDIGGRSRIIWSGA